MIMVTIMVLTVKRKMKLKMKTKMKMKMTLFPIKTLLYEYLAGMVIKIWMFLFYRIYPYFRAQNPSRIQMVSTCVRILIRMMHELIFWYWPVSSLVHYTLYLHMYNFFCFFIILSFLFYHNLLSLLQHFYCFTIFLCLLFNRFALQHVNVFLFANHEYHPFNQT